MKLARVLARVALLSLAAGAFIGLTRIYANSARLPLPDQETQQERQHRESAPQVTQFPEFVGEGIVFVIYAVGGRLIFRLRLSPVSRSEARPVLLNLQP